MNDHQTQHRVSRELVVKNNDHFIVMRNADGTYELYRARLEHVAHFKRKWQAVAHAAGEEVVS